MILSELRDYLQKYPQVTLHDLVLHFNIDAEALRGMLAQWMRKGKVKKLDPNSKICGSSCCKCDPALTEIYQWIEKK
ncbi:MAG: hypothetical protein RL637_533 [Pseudomonadota bacterium]|jgi:hypothetical protein